MKKMFLLALVVAMIFMARLVPGSDGTVAIATEVYNSSGEQLVQDSLELLKFRYETMYGTKSELPANAVTIIQDESSFFSALQQRFSHSEVAVLKDKGFVFCIYKQTPIYIKPSADRWVSLLRLSEQDRQEALARLAAAFDHEIVYHIAAKSDNEELGLSHELASYNWFVSNSRAGLDLRIHAAYRSFLNSLMAQAHVMEEKNAASKMAAKN